MQIYIHKNGEDWGPYTPAEVTEHLRNSVFSQEDFARTANMNEWIPLSDIAARLALEGQGDPPRSTEAEYSKEEITILKELYTMAFFQRRLVILFLPCLFVCSVLCSIVGTMNNTDIISLIGCFGCISLLIYPAYCFFRFKAALYNWWTAVLLLFLILIPGFLIIEMIISYFAVKKRYKECGVERGYFGASTRALQELKSQITSYN